MILISGGLGFIGSHTARALLDLGQSCVLTQHENAHVPDFVDQEVGRRIVIEQVDWTETASVLQLGKRHEITSIIHLAAPALTTDRIGDVDTTTRALLNALRAGREWGVARVVIASSIGLYIGVTQTPFREDLPLPMVTDDPVPVLKKSAELLAGLVAHGEEFELINLRISTIWGPLGPPDTPFVALPHLVHAAARGRPADLSRLRDTPHSDDGVDLCYVKDCALAIALLTTAETLADRTYNVGDGRPTTNRDVVAAIDAVLNSVPTADLRPGRDPAGPGHDTYLDITRLREDTGYRSRYGLERGVRDYLEWLASGHER
jgi:UDP-glucose 4-epimerase